jgi:tRNA threonylcarbamoyladenosine biosynthesis protein TsaE
LASNLPETVELHGEQATLTLGRRIGVLLRPGDCVALHGPLGAGKTTFVKGVAAALGVPPDEPIVSPTFVLVREYAGRLRLYHVDAYRLSGADELAAVGLEEMLSDAGGVTLIEWAERVASILPPDAWHVTLRHVDESRREAEIVAPARQD